MSQFINLIELSFAYLDNNEIISLFTANRPGQCDICFEPFAVLDEKYNTDLDVTVSCLRSRYLMFPNPIIYFLIHFLLLIKQFQLRLLLLVLLLMLLLLLMTMHLLL